MKRSPLAMATCTFLVLLLTLCGAQAAAIKLSDYFSDDMVLQHGKALTVWGYGSPDSSVSVSFADQTQRATVSKDGKWSVTLDALKPSSKPRSLTVSTANEKVSIDDVLVGDVWLFGRQTQTDISLGRSESGRKAAASSPALDKVRIMSIRTSPSKTPLNDLGAQAGSGWLTPDSKTAASISGAAYYLGKAFGKDSDTPIGIIDLNMGPHFALGWLSTADIAKAVTLYPNDGEYIDGNEIAWLPELLIKSAEERDSGKAQKDLDDYYQERVLKNAKGNPPKSQKPSLGIHPLDDPRYPSAGYNAVIHPLKNAALKGILLQLGNDYPFTPYQRLTDEGLSQKWPELNEAWGQSYRILKHGYRVTPATLPLIPESWRAAFGDEALPMAMIMPPASDLYMYAGHNREIREMQRRMTQDANGLGLIMPGMDNIPFSGQPADDELLAARCKAWIDSQSGPVLDFVTKRLNTAVISFKPGTAEGLSAKGDALDYFEAAGADRKFYPAEARIEGNTVALTSKAVGQITFVRFNWTEKPTEGLLNAGGLPALPFTTDPDWKFGWIIEQADPELPEEFHLTADKWKKQDIAIINGEIEIVAGGGEAPTIPRQPGPIGIYASPFGPNIYVINVEPDTAATGKLQKGDVIYGVNGKTFGDDTYREWADAITWSESEEAGGKFVVSIRRGKKLMDVELQLEVVGAYSATTPFYCPKSERIIEKAEQWVANRFRPEEGLGQNHGGFLGTDMLFLMASGKPEYLGLVRRHLYEAAEKRGTPEPDPHKGGVNNWGLGYDSLVAGEYYHLTGDKNILPYMMNLNEWMVMTQIKPRTDPDAPWEYAPTEEQSGGWRQRYHSVMSGSTYGLMPHAGMACTMGMLLAKEAALPIDEPALERALVHYHKGRAEHAYVQYTYANARVDRPQQIDPAKEAIGKLWTMNGKLGAAAALYNMIDDHATVAINSRFCVYTYNNTRHGHGGMFFNNYWTPIGAHLAGEAGFKHFMKGQRWWRELYRRPDGSFYHAARGTYGAGFGLHYAAHHKRLRFLGGTKTAFGPNPPAWLKPALAAHEKRDYKTCEDLITREMKARIITPEEKPVVEHFLASVQRLRASIEHDLTYTEKLIKDGRLAQAKLELPQLKGVLPASNARLQTIVTTVEDPEKAKEIETATREGIARQRSAQWAQRKADEAAKEAEAKAWQPIMALDTALQDSPEATKWKITQVEIPDNAPDGWTSPGFDDSSWATTTLPVSWRMYHTSLLRSHFDLENPKDLTGLRLKGLFFQQGNVVVYINGKLAAKIDNLGKGGRDVIAEFTPTTLKSLKKGRNTIAISTLHNRRWGNMRGTYTAVNNNGVGLILESRQN